MPASGVSNQQVGTIGGRRALARTHDVRRRGGQQTRAVAWGISLALHAVLVFICSLIVLRSAAPPPEDREPIIVSITNPGLASPSGRTEPATPSAPPSTPAAPAAAAVPALAAPNLPPAPDWPADPGAGEFGSAGAPQDGPTGADQAWAQRSGAEQAAMQAALDARGAADVRFAGMGVSNAQEIVYVVDASGSMVTSMPVVLEYLRRSITRLSRSQRFQLIFFGPEPALAAPHPGNSPGAHQPTWLIRAAPENVRAVMDWASRVIPKGRSNPSEAIRTALLLSPDAVFVLGSTVTGLGRWEASRDEILAEIDRLNPRDPSTGRRRAVIKTIQFLDEDPEQVLRAIGEEHGGADGFKFIDRIERPGS
ncbi:MAG: hypothetical protein SFZ24_05070 [Planctomycetota bacterium]|nr:hypothetical protein [Planctomycetota bacterium]